MYINQELRDEIIRNRTLGIQFKRTPLNQRPADPKPIIQSNEKTYCKTCCKCCCKNK